jgi:membrane protein YdbS with pleckstrin-like domain
MAQIGKYLIDSEHHAIEVRHHWAYLAQATLFAALFWVGGLVALWLFLDLTYLRIACVFFLLFTVLWLAWQIGEWWVERFVVTDRRVLLTTGILTKRVAVMPLAKVTDLTYERTIFGRLLGYGVFIIESAGQQQALRRIEYIPEPDALYHEVSALLFGVTANDDGTGAGSNVPAGAGPGPHVGPGSNAPAAAPGARGAAADPPPPAPWQAATPAGQPAGLPGWPAAEGGAAAATAVTAELPRF